MRQFSWAKRTQRCLTCLLAVELAMRMYSMQQNMHSRPRKTACIMCERVWSAFLKLKGFHPSPKTRNGVEITILPVFRCNRNLVVSSNQLLTCMPVMDIVKSYMWATGYWTEEMESTWLILILINTSSIQAIMITFSTLSSAFGISWKNSKDSESLIYGSCGHIPLDLRQWRFFGQSHKNK